MDSILNSNMLYNILYILVLAFVIYKCCEKFDYKLTWSVITIILTAFLTFSRGGIIVLTLLKDLTISALISIVLSYVFYKIYELTRSFLGFIVVSAILVFVIQYLNTHIAFLP